MQEDSVVVDRRECRIATNKSSVFGLKALSFHFMIFRRLQQLDMHSISSDTLSHLLLLVAAFISLFTFFRERISCDICFDFIETTDSEL